MVRKARSRRASGIVPVIIAGGGIAGLAMALTLQQLGVRCVVFEQVRSLRPLGVGLNLQPNAVRELFDLGLRSDWLDRTGAPIRQWALVARSGVPIHSEPRGRDAGYRWPQYAVHRGRLHMALAKSFTDRAGADALVTGHRVTGYAHDADGTVTVEVTRADARVIEHRARLLIAADGIHSVIRAQMHPQQPPIHWGGAIMWRGVSRARPPLGGQTFVGLGSTSRRVALYPISAPEPDTGLAEINWIAERVVDPGAGWERSGWFKPVTADSFAHHFDDFGTELADIPALIRDAETIYENPMIDRDPVDRWADGRVALLGDAAHPMYPTGSNNASQAIVAARILGARLLQHGLRPEALADYDATLRAPISELVLKNREAGPFGLLDLLEARADGPVTVIDVLPKAEREAFMARYTEAAGLDIARVNGGDPIIPPGARIGTTA